MGEEIIGIARHHLHMLGSDAVRLAHHLVETFAHDHFAEIRPRLAGSVGGRKNGEEPLDLAQRVASKLFRIGDEDRGRGRAVLGLAEEVGRTDLAVDALVGDDQRLGRSGQEIDADAAEQLALGFRDVGIAGSDDHVDGAHRLGAERHGGDRLHAAEDIDFVRPAQMHGGDDRGVGAALERRRAGHDALHASDARGNDRHVRRSHHGIAPARHVAPDRAHRDVAVSEHDAGKRLDLELAQRLLLFLREISHLRLGKLDVVEIALAQLCDGALDLGGAQPEACGRPVVEFL
jgi:hypothetical protein